MPYTLDKYCQLPHWRLRRQLLKCQLIFDEASRYTTEYNLKNRWARWSDANQFTNKYILFMNERHVVNLVNFYLLFFGQQRDKREIARLSLFPWSCQQNVCSYISNQMSLWLVIRFKRQLPAICDINVLNHQSVEKSKCIVNSRKQKSRRYSRNGKRCIQSPESELHLTFVGNKLT